MAKSTFLLIVALLSVTRICVGGQVVGVLDGDTLELMENGKAVRIRLANIDAPEKNQAFGDKAKRSLSDLCFGKDAQYRTQTIDRYGRTVAEVTFGGVQVNRAQVERGYAWVYQRYNQDHSLPAIEANARRQQRGLWVDNNPTPPWDFRHGTATTSATPSPCLTGPRGGHYQLINGKKHYGCSPS